MTIVPPKRPELSREFAVQLLAQYGVSASAGPVLLGRRGYYRDAMGKPGVNDRGEYDDAMCLVSPKLYQTFNANTDPSGHGGKLPLLQPGVWRYQLGIHHPASPGAYPCLVQAGPVTLTRDNGVTESGEFYIHIHKGGYNVTSSEGCQTIYPAQWQEFYDLVRSEMKRADVRTIPYVLTVREDA